VIDGLFADWRVGVTTTATRQDRSRLSTLVE
jgi:hypothetical protein